ncbi:LysR family transcriptional regulator [Carnimonas bestiolae]|uniref:LysR family transcriptional regulator n=1 Tax=Carnimonas bestiolae TaxID=3402172 RepID=UPI003F4AB111
MSRFEEMEAFVAVVDTLSITAAAQRLGLSKQLVSKRLQTLEGRLGVRLLNRSTRRMQPTALGLDYASQVRNILNQIDLAEQDVGLQSKEVRGRLRVSAPLSFSMQRLRSVLPSFIARYPSVDLHYELSDRRVDLLAEGYDMVIRIGELSDSTLIARRLCEEQLVTCASAEYLAQHGTPQRPEQLHEHACLLYGHQSQVVWHYRRGSKAIEVAVEAQRRFHANNGELVMDAALAGMGIVQLPHFIVEEALADGRLTAILDKYRPAPEPVNALYPHHREKSRPVRALVDMLVEALNDAPAP